MFNSWMQNPICLTLRRSTIGKQLCMKEERKGERDLTNKKKLIPCCIYNKKKIKSDQILRSTPNKQSGETKDK